MISDWALFHLSPCRRTPAKDFIKRMRAQILVRAKNRSENRKSLRVENSRTQTVAQRVNTTTKLSPNVHGQLNETCVSGLGCFGMSDGCIGMRTQWDIFLAYYYSWIMINWSLWWQLLLRPYDKILRSHWTIDSLHFLSISVASCSAAVHSSLHTAGRAAKSPNAWLCP